MTDTPLAASHSHGAGSLIPSALHPRAQKAVNLYGFAHMAVMTSKSIRDAWRARTAYKVTVDGDDALYPELEAWLIAQIPSRRRKATKVRYVRPSAPGQLAEEVSDRPESKPTFGNLAMLYDGAIEQPVSIGGHIVKVHVTQPDVGSDTSRRWKPPVMTFTAQSVEARDAVLSMLDNVATERASETRVPSFYTSVSWGGFSRSRHFQPRRLDSIVLPDGIVDPLIDDLDVFLQSEAKYAELGIPWHRGYLLTGVPGTGKTSLAAALADRFAMDTYFLIPSAVHGDEALVQLLADIPPRSLLVAEDIDISHASRDRDDDSHSSISMQMLLQAFDGMVTPHGMVTVLTTNHPDVLDEALTRPGRCDLVIEIPKLGNREIIEMFRRFTGIDYTARLPRRPIEETGSALVEIVKPYIHDKAAMHQAILTWCRAARSL